MRRYKYSSNPKHELPGSIGQKGTPLDISPWQAERLLNDEHRCYEVPGRRQFVGVLNGRIYAFQPDGTGAFHAYPITGNEVCRKFAAISARIAALLGINVKRLSRMDLV